MVWLFINTEGKNYTGTFKASFQNKTLQYLVLKSAEMQRLFSKPNNVIFLNLKYINNQQKLWNRKTTLRIKL